MDATFCNSKRPAETGSMEGHFQHIRFSACRLRHGDVTFRTCSVEGYVPQFNLTLRNMFNGGSLSLNKSDPSPGGLAGRALAGHLRVTFGSLFMCGLGGSLLHSYVPRQVARGRVSGRAHRVQRSAQCDAVISRLGGAWVQVGGRAMCSIKWLRTARAKRAPTSRRRPFLAPRNG